MQLLVSHGAFVEANDLGGYPPLVGASGSGSASLVQLLLKWGANPNGKDKWVLTFNVSIILFYFYFIYMYMCYLEVNKNKIIKTAKTSGYSLCFVS